MLFSWHPQGAFLATCGANRIVNIFNRQGDPVFEIPLEGTGKCLQLCWDETGETLAILQSGSPAIRLWDANQSVASEFDAGMKDITYIKWALTGEMLALGTQKGNLLLYNKRTTKKQSILGKHTKKIISGAWSSTDRLALASEDRQLTLSNTEGARNRHQPASKCWF